MTLATLPFRDLYTDAFFTGVQLYDPEQGVVSIFTKSKELFEKPPDFDNEEFVRTVRAMLAVYGRMGVDVFRRILENIDDPLSDESEARAAALAGIAHGKHYAHFKKSNEPQPDEPQTNEPQTDEQQPDEPDIQEKNEAIHMRD